MRDGIYRNIYKCPEISTYVLKMGQIKNQIKKLFYNHPTKLFHIREIARLTGIPKTTVASKIKLLLKEKLIKEEKDVFKGFVANESSSYYRREKMLFAIKEIYDSGLVDYLYETLTPSCIILFGSMRKGEYTDESDIDIFIQSEEDRIDLSKYKKILDRDIQVFFRPKPEEVSKHLMNNVLNGFVLKGYINIL